MSLNPVERQMEAKIQARIEELQSYRFGAAKATLGALIGQALRDLSQVESFSILLDQDIDLDEQTSHHRVAFVKGSAGHSLSAEEESILCSQIFETYFNECYWYFDALFVQDGVSDINISRTKLQDLIKGEGELDGAAIFLRLLPGRTHGLEIFQLERKKQEAHDALSEALSALEHAVSRIQIEAKEGGAEILAAWLPSATDALGKGKAAMATVKEGVL